MMTEHDETKPFSLEEIEESKNRVRQRIQEVALQRLTEIRLAERQADAIDPTHADQQQGEADKEEAKKSDSWKFLLVGFAVLFLIVQIIRTIR